MFGINDPSALLRPWKNLQQFSEELYAMFSKGGPPAGAEPASTRKAQEEAQAPRRSSEPEAPRADMNATRRTRLEDARARSTAPETTARDSHAARPRTPQAVNEGVTRREPAPAVEAGPAPGLNAAPARRVATASRTIAEKVKPVRADDVHAGSRRSVELPDQSDHPQTEQPGRTPPKPKPESGRSTTTAPVESSPAPQPAGPVPRKSEQPKGYEPPRADWERPKRTREGPPPYSVDFGNTMSVPGGGGGGSTTAFMGKVVSGTGDTYMVVLYQNGPKGTPDDSPVEVTIPMIDPDEQIPADTWLSPVFQFDAPPDEFGNVSANPVYSCQPPVWMS